MRIVHLIDSGLSPQGTWRPADLELRACRVLMERAPAEQRLVLLGPAGAARRAGRLGIAPDLVLCPPLGRPELAWRRLRRVAGDLRPDVVHCWSPAAARLARLVFSRAPISAGCEGLAPPVEVQPVEADARAAARMRLRKPLGLHHDTPLLALIGRGSADAQRFLYTLGSMQYAGVNVVGIIPAWARQTARAQRFAQRFGSRIRFVIRDDPWPEVLAGADLALLEGPETPTCGIPRGWFIAEAHSLGVPVVTARGPTVLPLYPREAEACLAANGTAPELARVAMPLIEDRAGCEAMGRVVQGHLASMACIDRLVEGAMQRWRGFLDGASRGAQESAA